jgi:hypothetical protein
MVHHETMILCVMQMVSCLFLWFFQVILVFFLLQLCNWGNEVYSLIKEKPHTNQVVYCILNQISRKTDYIYCINKHQYMELRLDTMVDKRRAQLDLQKCVFRSTKVEHLPRRTDLHNRFCFRILLAFTDFVIV